MFSNNNNSFNHINIINNSSDEESRIHAWLSPLDARIRHQDIRSQRAEGVGASLLETREFKSWYGGGGGDETGHGILFCDGNPGVRNSHITSLVIDKLCDEAIERETAVTCFYFDSAMREEQSPINMLGSLLRQLASRFERIPDVIVQEFRNQQKVIGGRGPQISGIVKMFQIIGATMHAFICIDALDECAPDRRVDVLDSLGQILRALPNARIFMTGGPNIRPEIGARLGGGAVFISIEPKGGDTLRYPREGRLLKRVDVDPGHRGEIDRLLACAATVSVLLKRKRRVGRGRDAEGVKRVRRNGRGGRSVGRMHEVRSEEEEESVESGESEGDSGSEEEEDSGESGEGEESGESGEGVEDEEFETEEQSDESGAEESGESEEGEGNGESQEEEATDESGEEEESTGSEEGLEDEWVGY